MLSGASKKVACREANISSKTYNRWKDGEEVKKDKRPTCFRQSPKNKLSEEENNLILETCNKKEFASLPPSQIVPKLADKGVYIASESTFYRVLRKHNQLQHRGRAKASNSKKKPTTHIAKAANELWSWDITYLPQSVRGKYFYLYLVEDVFSRYGVAWEVHEVESGEHAAELFTRAVIKEECYKKPLVLHSDNGAPMKSFTLRAKLQELGIATSFSRPRVSNDNPYSESLFRTLKYSPSYPENGFSDISEARSWVKEFMDWYNHQHCHSKIKFVTPSQRHHGKDEVILEKRKEVYQKARLKNPSRWANNIRNWQKPMEVALNPEKNDVIKQAA